MYMSLYLERESASSLFILSEMQAAKVQKQKRGQTAGGSQGTQSPFIFVAVSTFPATIGTARPITHNSVESDHGCTSSIYFDNAGDNPRGVLSFFSSYVGSG